VSSWSARASRRFHARREGYDAYAKRAAHEIVDRGEQVIHQFMRALHGTDPACSFICM
jgi:hypothetical protein